jgi:amino acid transporter
MSRTADVKDLDVFTKGSIVISAGIFGTGSIFRYRDALVHDTLTRWTFRLTVAAFAASAVAGVVLRLRRRLYDQQEPKGVTPVVMLLGFIVGLIGTTALTMLRNP